MKSIQTKFVVLILGCVLLSSVVIGGAGIYNAQKVVDNDSAQIMNLLCNERAQNIDALLDRKSTRLNSSHIQKTRMPSSA